MFRTLLTTTAIATLLTAGAIAQDTTTPAPATDAPATTTTAPAADGTVTEQLDVSILASGYTVTDKDNLATEIIGKQVYSSDASDAQHIGDINNLVIGDKGEVAAVIIGVGGFLGLGQKNVAVNYAELHRVLGDNNSERFVLPTTKEALEQAPEFKTTDDAAANPPADQTMAPAPAGTTDSNAMSTDTTNKAAATTINRAELTDVPLTAEELIGTNVYGPADEHLGTIGDVVLGQDGKSVEAVIIDFGGFLGIGTKPVAVAIENLRFATDPNGNKYLFVNVTRDQLDQAVAYNKDTFLNERSTQLLVTGPVS